MSRFIHHLSLIAAIAVLSATALAQDAVEPKPAEQPAAAVPERAEGPRVQLAILLDTSGSMSGLIEQAKTELWQIVNELITAKQDGKQPSLQVALYEYGKSSLTPESNWIRQITPLTDDLDKVSEELFKLTTNGGDEYCGAVIERAAKDLAWSGDHNDLKMIVIAGNEPFSQGPVDYKKACKDAIAKGIIVNTIHCGGGIPDGWRDGALLADGKPMNIDHNAQVVHVESPQDKKIAELGVAINKTYIPFGAHGKAGAERQVAQDANASSVSPQIAQQRAVTKANGYYRNSAWCLADSYLDGKVDWTKIKKEDLPENMREMTIAQREAYIKGKLDERKTIQDEINTLNKARVKYVAEKRKELAADGKETLDAALIGAIREQATKKKFDFAEDAE